MQDFGQTSKFLGKPSGLIFWSGKANWHTTNCLSSVGCEVQTLDQLILWDLPKVWKGFGARIKDEFVSFMFRCAWELWSDVRSWTYNEHILKTSFITGYFVSERLICFFLDMWANKIYLRRFIHLGLHFELNLKKVFKQFESVVFTNENECASGCWLEKCWGLWGRHCNENPATASASLLIGLLEREICRCGVCLTIGKVLLLKNCW